MSGSVHRRERLIVGTRIVRLPRSLLDDDALPAATLSRHLRIHVVLTIAPARQPALAVAERTPADVSGRRLTLPLLDFRQHVPRLLRNVGVTRLSGRQNRYGC